MGGHIILSLRIMSILYRLSGHLSTLRPLAASTGPKRSRADSGHNAVQRIAHIRPHIFIPILVQAQRAGCVLDKQREQADLVLRDFRERRGDVRCYEIGAACG